jgi:hypothetical protein
MANPIVHEFPRCLFIGGSRDGERETITIPAHCTEQPAIEIGRRQREPLPWITARPERYVPREVPFDDLFTTVVMALDFLSETEVLEGYARLTNRHITKDTTNGTPQEPG